MQYMLTEIVKKSVCDGKKIDFFRLCISQMYRISVYIFGSMLFIKRQKAYNYLNNKLCKYTKYCNYY